jgi:hypothetical protein
VPTEWSGYWQDVRNLRWSVVDQQVFERVADLLGWGPDRRLLEIGAGRGLHSKLLYETMRCGRPDLYEVCPEACRYMERAGLSPVCDEARLGRDYDVVWSYGLPEHFEDPARQDIIDRHFELSRDWVILVVPSAAWLRRLAGRRDRVAARDFTKKELERRLEQGARRHWGGAADSGVAACCPLFGIRHIPEAFYVFLERLIGWALPGGLLIGWARRDAARGEAGRAPCNPGRLAGGAC